MASEAMRRAGWGRKVHTKETPMGATEQPTEVQNKTVNPGDILCLEGVYGWGRARVKIFQCRNEAMSECG